MGAQRWIDLGIIQIQPSELMKIAAVMALARYFNGLTIEEIGKPLAPRSCRRSWCCCRRRW